MVRQLAPPQRTPCSAMAATTTTAAAARPALAPLGFASANKGRATLVALLTYFAPDRIHLGRSAPASEIGERIANLIVEFGLTDAASWNERDTSENWTHAQRGELG